jgi:hypothetical protein
MLRRTTSGRMALAAAALALAGPAMAGDTCLTDATGGAQCDLFLDQYRGDEVPVGTTDVWTTDDFLIERYQGFRPEASVEFPSGRDVVYWDGDSAMIVPEETGPRLEITDW